MRYALIISILLPGILYLLATPTDRWTTPLTWARIAAFMGITLLLWQYLLGIRQLAGRFVVDLITINKLHKFMGMYGFLLILLHPLILIVSNGLQLYLPNLASEYSNFVLLGEIAFLFLFSTWIASAFLRKRLSFRVWKRFHLLNYLILSFALVHSLYLKPLATNYMILHYYLWLIAGIFVLSVLVRLLAQFGLLKFPTQLVSKENITHDIVELRFAASEDLLNSQPGQFMYVQIHPLGESHPFTIVKVDKVTQTVSISPKILGPFSKKLNMLPAGARVFLDGPYGVFTHEAGTTDTTVFIAGGIGITPFMRQIRTLAPQGTKLVLFYGCKTVDDLAFGEELMDLEEKYPNFRLVPVCSNEPDFPGEKGFINYDLMNKHMSQEMASSNFFICGPAGMMKMIKQDLVSHGVSAKQIFTEEFSL